MMAYTFAQNCDFCAKYPKPGQRLLKCSQCKVNMYCNKDCQKRDWRIHKPLCKELASGDTHDVKVINEGTQCDLTTMNHHFDSPEFKRIIDGLPRDHCTIVQENGQVTSYEIDGSEIRTIMGSEYAPCIASMKKKLNKCHVNERLVFTIVNGKLFAHFHMSGA